jgi:hypothetical protein
MHSKNMVSLYTFYFCFGYLYFFDLLLFIQNYQNDDLRLECMKVVKMSIMSISFILRWSGALRSYGAKVCDN